MQCIHTIVEIFSYSRDPNSYYFQLYNLWRLESGLSRPNIFYTFDKHYNESKFFASVMTWSLFKNLTVIFQNKESYLEVNIKINNYNIVSTADFQHPSMKTTGSVKKFRLIAEFN